MKKQTNKKEALLDAFDQSETKQAAEACRIAGVAKSTYYFHAYKDPEFRRQVMEKQRDHLSARIASV
jgi:ACT domain-containing protein